VSSLIIVSLTPLLISAAAPGDVALSVAGQRSTRGLLQVCLTRDPAHFPACVNDEAAIKRTVLASQTQLTFQDLPSGVYAISLFHDENRNGRLDTILGIPREGFGFSRNPPIRFGAPRFSAARFSVASGESAERVRLKYLF
jgi:uncharacterized protein (DUF2141 family)